jgi:hypothetical protein
MGEMKRGKAYEEDHILGLEDGKKQFADCVLRMTQAFALCCTLWAWS